MTKRALAMLCLVFARWVRRFFPRRRRRWAEPRRRVLWRAKYRHRAYEPIATSPKVARYSLLPGPLQTAALLMEHRMGAARGEKVALAKEKSRRRIKADTGKEGGWQTRDRETLPSRTTNDPAHAKHVFPANGSFAVAEWIDPLAGCRSNATPSLRAPAATADSISGPLGDLPLSLASRRDLAED